MKQTFKLTPKHIHLIALIKANVRRPGTAFLARELRVHKNTVLYYLKILSREGFLDKNGLPTDKVRDSV